MPPREYLAQYHEERPHQGLDNELIIPMEANRLILRRGHREEAVLWWAVEVVLTAPLPDFAETTSVCDHPLCPKTKLMVAVRAAPTEYLPSEIRETGQPWPSTSSGFSRPFPSWNRAQITDFWWVVLSFFDRTAT